MATRRSRLSVKPNVGPKLGRGPARSNPPSASASPVAINKTGDGLTPSASASPVAINKTGDGHTPSNPPSASASPVAINKTGDGPIPSNPPSASASPVAINKTGVGTTLSSPPSAEASPVARSKQEEQIKEAVVTPLKESAVSHSSDLDATPAETQVSSKANDDAMMRSATPVAGRDEVPDNQIKPIKGKDSAESQPKKPVIRRPAMRFKPVMTPRGRARTPVSEPSVKTSTEAEVPVEESKTLDSSNDSVHQKATEEHVQTGLTVLAKQKPAQDTGAQDTGTPDVRIQSQETTPDDAEINVCVEAGPPTDAPNDDVTAKQSSISSPSIPSSISHTIDKDQTEPSMSLPDLSNPLKSPARVAHRMRGRFIKARPNIAEAGRARLRHSSMSGSEQEDERKRTSSFEEHAHSSSSKSQSFEEHERVGAAAGERVSPIGSPERTPHGKRTSKNIDEDWKASEVSRSRKRWRKTEMLDFPVDRSKLTLGDLIYMNPISNPMRPSATKGITEKTSADGSDEIILDAPPDSPPEPMQVEVEEEAEEEEAAKEKENDKDESEDDAGPVPQVTIGPNGEIIIKESTLLIEAPKEDRTSSMEILHETSTSNNIGYGRRSQMKLWSQSETKKFYLALSAIGTDFSLMCKLFPKRNRTELKRKFKKEEKINKALIDRAIRDKHHFEQSFFDELITMDHEEEERQRLAAVRQQVRRQEAAKALNKPKRKSRRDTRFLYEVSDSDDNNDKEENESLAGDAATAADVSEHTPILAVDEEDSNHSHMDNEEDNDCEVVNFKPSKTRSGRQPRQSKPFTIDLTNTKPKRAQKAPNTDSTLDTTTSSVLPGQPKSGQFISLSDLTNVTNQHASQIQAGSLVFVTSNATSSEKGVEEGMIHVYLVAQDKNADTASTSHDAPPASMEGQSTASSILKSNVASTDPPPTDGDGIVIDARNMVDGAGYESGDGEGLTLVIDPLTGMVCLEGQEQQSMAEVNADTQSSDEPSSETTKVDTPVDSTITHTGDETDADNGSAQSKPSCSDNRISLGPDKTGDTLISEGCHGSHDSLQDSLCLQAPSTHDILTEIAHGSPTRGAAISTPAKIALTENVIQEIIAEDVS